jgi:hypothetical protein
MFLEVIKQDPSAPEPYQALAALHEDRGQLGLALLFGQLAAHTAPAATSGEEWARLGADADALQLTVQAADCYRRAAVESPSEPGYRLALAGLLEKLGDGRRATRCYKKVLEGGQGSPGQREMAASRLNILLQARKERLAAKVKLHRIPWKVRPMKVRCGQCGLTFRASYHLVRHTQAVHNKVKNYECDKPGCGQRFGWLAGLQAHRIRGHGERGAHACTSCTVSYATPSLLAQHVSRIHLREKRCVCEEPGCSAAFVWMSDLLAHRRRLHGLAKLHCTVPGCRRTKGFLWQTALYRHHTTFHQG